MKEIIASPSVRARAAEMKINLEELASNLGRSHIALEDLSSQGQMSTAPSRKNYWDVDHSEFGEVEVEPLSSLAKLAADNLSAAHSQIPSVTHFDKAEISQIEKFRNSLKAEAQTRGIKLSALAFYVKALACALSTYPRFNSSLSADGQNLVLKKYIHIGIAVDTDYGLVVPVIRDADQKGVWQIAGEIADLAKRAQARKIRPEEMGGASMTISSLGGIGGTAFTPIVNPPEVAILGLSRTQVECVLQGKKPVERAMLPLSLSYDHRVINGADAARFCRHLAELIEDPRKMLR